MKKHFLLGSLALLLAFGFLGCDMGDTGGDDGSATEVIEVPQGWLRGITDLTTNPVLNSIRFEFTPAKVNAGTTFNDTDEIIWMSGQLSDITAIRHGGTSIRLGPTDIIRGKYSGQISSLDPGTTYTVAAVSTNNGVSAYTIRHPRTAGSTTPTIDKKLTITGLGRTNLNKTISVGLHDSTTITANSSISGSGTVNSYGAAANIDLRQGGTSWSGSGDYYISLKIGSDDTLISKRRVNFTVSANLMTLADFDTNEEPVIIGPANFAPPGWTGITNFRTPAMLNSINFEFTPAVDSPGASPMYFETNEIYYLEGNHSNIDTIKSQGTRITLGVEHLSFGLFSGNIGNLKSGTTYTVAAVSTKGGSSAYTILNPKTMGITPSSKKISFTGLAAYSGKFIGISLFDTNDLSGTPAVYGAGVISSHLGSATGIDLYHDVSNESRPWTGSGPRYIRIVIGNNEASYVSTSTTITSATTTIPLSRLTLIE